MDLDWLLKTFAAQGPLVIGLIVIVWFQNKQAGLYVKQLQEERTNLIETKDESHKQAVEWLTDRADLCDSERDILQKKCDDLYNIIAKHKPSI